jgi:hypothetical protein
MGRGTRWIVMLGLLVASAVHAVKSGDVLYVRARDTGLMSRPTPTADAVRTLQPGTPVSYVAPARDAKGWHEVQAGESRGFVYQSNLSTQKPKAELVKHNGPALDPTAFASSGAATKALTEGAVRYGTTTKPEYERAVKDIERAEAIAKSITPAELAMHESKSSLHPMVSEGAAP